MICRCNFIDLYHTFVCAAFTVETLRFQYVIYGLPFHDIEFGLLFDLRNETVSQIQYFHR